MAWLNEPDINERYTGVIRWDDSNAAKKEIKTKIDEIWFKYHLVAKRHRISLINDGLELFRARGMQRWEKIFSGELFTKEYGYSGPGEGKPGDVYSIGTYGAWRSLKYYDKYTKSSKKYWDDENILSAWEFSNRIVNYFEKKLFTC